jgi:hypothetical protein
VLDPLARLPPTSYLSLPGYAAIAEVYLTLWKLGWGQDLRQRRAIQTAAKRACKTLWGYTRVFPIGRPRALLAQGQRFWQAGQPARAISDWQAGLADAQRLQMPYEQALLHAQLAQRLPADDPARASHHEQARAIFRTAGASADLAALEEIKR